MRTRRPLPDGFGTIWTTVALDLVGFGLVLPILPLYAERYDASPTTIGMLVASFSLAQLVAAPILGRLSDRVGRKRVLLLSLAGTGAASLLTGLAPSLAVLFAARVLDGASGGSVSVAQAAVADLAPRGDRARLLGLLSAAYGVGFVAGPLLGSIAAVAGPRAPFLLAAAIAAANGVRAWRRLPDPPRVRAEPASPPRRGGAPGLAAVGFLSVAAFAGFEATFALLGARRFGLTIGSAAFVFGLAGVLVAFSSAGLVHAAVDRLGHAGALRAALLGNAVGLALVAVASSWVVLLGGLAALAVGQGLATPTLAALAAKHAGAHRRGAALGVQQAAASAGRVAGPALAGLCFQLGGPAVPMIAAAGLSVVATSLVQRRAPALLAAPGLDAVSILK